MDNAVAPLTSSGQAEPVSTGVQPTRQLSSLQYGQGPALVSGGRMEMELSSMMEQVDIGRSPTSYYTSPVLQHQDNRQLECE